MRNVPSPDLRLALAAAAALVVFSGGFAHAQYYPPYERYDHSDYYFNDRPPGFYDRHRRRDLDEAPRDRRLEERPVHTRKPKHRHKKPAAVANKKPLSTVKGPYQIVVSLDKQSIALYGAEGLIQKSVVSTGKRGHSTPAGVFSVLGKERYHRSNIYSAAPMPLMQRITWSGIALHQGPLPGYPASHGCIRLTKWFAHFLWKTTKIGARVIVAHGNPAPAAISNAKLFSPVLKIYDPVAKPASMAAAAISENKHFTDATEAPAGEADAVTVAAAGHDGFYKPPVISSWKGPVSVFISRKTAKLYVRYNYEPILEAPVGIERPDEPIGTHVFTAEQTTDNGRGMRWNVISIPTPKNQVLAERKQDRRRKVLVDAAGKPAMSGKTAQTPAAALDRIDIPKETAERISELLSPGSSMTISDYGISDETGKETDFIILTR